MVVVYIIILEDIVFEGLETMYCNLVSLVYRHIIKVMT